MHIIAEDHEIEMVKEAGVKHCFVRLTNDQAREFIETDPCLASHILLDGRISLQGSKRLINLVSERVMPEREYWPWPRDYYPVPWKSELRNQSPEYKQRFVETFRQQAQTKGFEVTEEFGKELQPEVIGHA